MKVPGYNNAWAARYVWQEREREIPGTPSDKSARLANLAAALRDAAAARLMALGEYTTFNDEGD